MSSSSHAPTRQRLAEVRSGKVHEFRLAGFDAEGYIRTGEHEDGRLGEVFIEISKRGSLFSGLMDTVATLTSVALQYGVPLKALVEKFNGARFEPNGIVFGAPEEMGKPVEATSIVDYIFRWLDFHYGAKVQVKPMPKPAPELDALRYARRQEWKEILITLRQAETLEAGIAAVEHRWEEREGK